MDTHVLPLKYRSSPDPFCKFYDVYLKLKAKASLTSFESTTRYYYFALSKIAFISLSTFYPSTVLT